MPTQSEQSPGGEDTRAPEASELPHVIEPKLEPETEKRPDPTRYGDWESGGRCIDF